MTDNLKRAIALLDDVASGISATDAYQRGRIAERIMIVAWLRNGNAWLNNGECCGAKDSDGVCLAPACPWGEELEALHKAADAIEAGEHLAQETQT